MSKLLIFTAPSGAGKTTIVRHLLANYEELAFSVSATTRARRGREEHGKDYYFFSLEEWKERTDAGDFLEYEEVYENQYYGTLRSEVERLWNLGKYVIFDIDVKGAMKLKSSFGKDALTVFVKPPSKEILFERLRQRKTDSKRSIEKRIKRATEELTYEAHCDIVLMNDDLNTALKDAEKIVESFLVKVS